MLGYLNLLILGYLPWFVVDKLTTYFSCTIAIAISLAAITPFTCQAAYARDYISLVFVSGFIAYTINLVHPNLILGFYGNNILLIVGILSVLSVILAHPPTLVHAKRSVSPAHWKHPLFTKINHIISLVWAGIFISGYILETIKIPHSSMINIGMVMLGFEFSRQFPEYYKKRQLARTSQV